MANNQPHWPAQPTEAALDARDEPAGVLGGDGAKDDLDDGPAGAGIHGGELVPLPDAFQLGDGKTVDGNEVARPGRPVRIRRVVTSMSLINRAIAG